MNELLLETLKLRQQLNIYKNMITNQEQLLREVHEWRNRFTNEREMYESVYAVILDKLDNCAYNIRTSLKNPRVLTHMHNETSLALNLKIEPDD